MPNEINDRTTISVDLKFAIFIIGTLVSATLAAGGVGWQLVILDRQLTDLKAQAAKLELQQHEIDRRTIEIGVTLKAKGVIQ